LNSLTKFLFNKYGFESLMSNENYPSDLKTDVCKALQANVVNHKGMFKTKLGVELRDCTNKLVFKTKIGESRKKEFDKAYNLALRDAFTSFKEANYKYNGGLSNPSIVKVKPKTISPKIEAAKEVIEVQSKKQPKILEARPNMEVKTDNSKILKISNDILYAQATSSGYQVVDSTPKIVMVLYASGKQNTYIVKGGNAIVYEEDGFWYMSEINGDSTITERLNIKF